MDFESILYHLSFILIYKLGKKKKKQQACKNISCNTKTKTDFYGVKNTKPNTKIESIQPSPIPYRVNKNKTKTFIIFI